MKQLKQILKVIFLILVFVSTLFCYGFIFRLLTDICQYLFDVRIYWDQAPFFKNMFGVGIALFLAVIAVWGLNNLFSGRTFFQQVAWRRLLILLFCFVMFETLTHEADELIPQLKAVDEEEGPSLLLRAVPLILTILVGYAMWPRKSSEAGKNEGSDDEREMTEPADAFDSK